MNLEEKLKDEELLRLSNKAAQSFTDSLSKDEIKNCIMSAIWSAVNNFKEDKKTKFTTYLYKGVIYECIKQKKSNSRKSKALHFDINNALSVPSGSNFTSEIEMLEEINTCEDPSLIFERFYDNLTLKDMAEKRGVSKEAIRFKLKKNLNFLRNRLSEVYN
tara:strand:- start:2698 stop:3180 length:483 start_codon:yes stop_codon:yes gene_type:complete